MGNQSISRRIFIVLAILFVVSLFGARAFIAGVAALDPVAVLGRLELWRVITYPLAVDFIGLLVAMICFTAPGEEMEQMLGARGFLGSLGIVIVSAALLHLAMFAGTRTVLLGPANPSLFMLVGFVYLFPESTIRLLFFSMRAWVLLSFIAATILFVTVFMAVQTGASPLLFLSYGGFGMLAGAVYFHVRFQKYPVLLRPIRSLERIVARSDDRAPEPGGARGVWTATARVRMPFQRAAGREPTDQDRLDSILDRINEKGYASLSEEDKTFLRDFSARI